MTYDRAAAVAYAHRHALVPNPAYYNFEKLGGDCTSFVSQCLFAGWPQMNHTPNGWFYRSAAARSPSWTGVEFLRSFLVRPESSPGPRARELPLEAYADLDALQLGDLVQLSFDGTRFAHTVIVVETDGNEILVAAHTFDRDYYPLTSYDCRRARALLIQNNSSA